MFKTPNANRRRAFFIAHLRLAFVLDSIRPAAFLIVSAPFPPPNREWSLPIAPLPPQLPWRSHSSVFAPIPLRVHGRPALYLRAHPESLDAPHPAPRTQRFVLSSAPLRT